jgi:hypothetical protein
MFVEIDLPADALALVDRDTIEDALVTALEANGVGEVTGAGMSLTGGGGSLDVELSRPAAGLHRIREVLRGLRVPQSVQLRVNGANLSVYSDDAPPKAQRRKRRWQPAIGDVIEVPLSKGDFAYCRATPQRHLYQLFDVRSARHLSIDSLRNAPTLKRARFWDLEQVMWVVIGNVPFDVYEPQQYRIGYAPVELVQAPDGMLDTGNVIPGRVLSAAELQHFEPIAFGGPEALIAYLESRVAGGG